MQDWNLDRVNRFIENKVEESTALEYKRAASLVKDSDRKKEDLVKQVTAMANAAGGMIIYGIAEYDDKSKKHVPEKLDPIDRSEISKEWLDSIIHSIQPCIDGVSIHPVADVDDTNKVYYVIEVPQSHTAHQARDFRYYRRRNFQIQPMEDYEVREVMSRKSHPLIKASIWINKRPLERGKKGKVLLKLKNVGTTICQQYMAALEVPVSVQGNIWFGENVQIRTADDQKNYWSFSLGQNMRKDPLFPGSCLILSEEFSDGSGMRASDDSPIVSTNQLKISIYADEMPAIRASIDPAVLCDDWVEVEPTISDQTFINSP